MNSDNEDGWREPEPSPEHQAAVAERIARDERERQEADARHALIFDPAEVKAVALRDRFTEWLVTHPGGSFLECRREMYAAQDARRQQDDAERAAQDSKQAKLAESARESIHDALGDPDRLRSLYSDYKSTAHADHWLGPELAGRVRAVLAANPRHRAYKNGKVVNFNGPKRDRSDEPYFDQTPSNIRKAVEEGRLPRADKAIADVIDRHNRRVYRAVKDKTKRITRQEIAAQAHCGVTTVKVTIQRLIAAGEMEVVSAGTGRQDGAIYRFPSRSEQRNGRALVSLNSETGGHSSNAR